MLIPNHPHDERLSALASGDTDATADASLTAHVSTCIRCTDLVAELGALRASLAQLPDVPPVRPLRLLPPVEADASRVDRVGGWARRFFAPVLTAGAALAMVGLVGTAAPAMSGLSGSFQDVGSELQAEASPAAAAAQASEPGAEAPAAADGAGAAASAEEAVGGETFSGSDRLSPEESGQERTMAAASAGPQDDGDRDAAAAAPLPAERSPWPMVLFTGVALMIAAALLRWILAPRAG